MPDELDSFLSAMPVPKPGSFLLPSKHDELDAFLGTMQMPAKQDLAAPAPVEQVPGMERLGPLPGVPRATVDVQPESLITPPRRYGGQAQAPSPVPKQTPAPTVQPPQQPISQEPTIGPAKPSLLNVVKQGALGRLFGEPESTAQSFLPEGQKTPNLLRFEAAVPTSAPPEVKAASEFVSGLTSPDNALIMAGTSGLGALGGELGSATAGKLVSMGFSAQMLNDSYNQLKAAGMAAQQGDWDTARRLATHGTLATVMAALGIKHGMSAEPVAPTATPSMVADARKPFASEAPPRYVTEPRDTVAQQLMGKSYSELAPADRVEVDKLVAGGDRATRPLNRAQRRAQTYPPSTGQPAQDFSAPAPVETPARGTPATTPDLAAPRSAEPLVREPSRVERVSSATPNPPTAAVPTAPESPATYTIQVQQLGEGLRKVVMLPKGEAWMPDQFPENVAITHDSFGNRYLYRTDLINKASIHAAAKGNTLNELLGHPEAGMGAPDKTEIQGPPAVVTAKAADGTEVQSTATDQASLPMTQEVTGSLVPPGGTLEVKPVEAAVGERTGAPGDLATPTPVETPATPVAPTVAENATVQPEAAPAKPAHTEITAERVAQPISISHRYMGDESVDSPETSILSPIATPKRNRAKG